MLHIRAPTIWRDHIKALRHEETDVMQKKQRIVITGGNTGIGLATAANLSARGHAVIIACRNQSKAQEAIDSIRAQQPDADIEARSLDLASFDSIRTFSKQLVTDYPIIDVLINNAGAYPTRQQFTAEGFELQFGVNYLGHVLLTDLLLPALEASSDARIVHLSSIMHNLGKIDFSSFKGRKRYSGTAAYGQSKLANLLFSNELARRLPASITSNAVHPGGVDSDIYRELPSALHWFLRLFLISTKRAGAYVADMAVSPKWHGRSGEFKSAHGPLPVSRHGRNAALAERLYLESCVLVDVSPR
jgi:NAD(P)-dependent dehydrogenase (short-subunit alcohol dehydrogenase family)